jgi:hypothetical protein
VGYEQSKLLVFLAGFSLRKNSQRKSKRLENLELAFTKNFWEKKGKK